MKTKKIKIYYQKITPESAEIGDFDETGEHDETEFSDDETLDDVVFFLKKQNTMEASSSLFHNEIWYTSIDPDRDYQDGSETYYTYHLENFNLNEQKYIYTNLIK